MSGLRQQRHRVHELTWGSYSIYAYLIWIGVFWSNRKRGREAKLLKGLVGAWGFEPQTPTVSRECSTPGEVL